MPNRKFLVLNRGPKEKTQPSPAQMQEMYKVFQAWSEKFKDSIVDMGSGLKSGGKVLSASGVADGPFVESKEVVGGYMIVAAEDYEGAVQIAKASPGMFMPGSSLEIRELASP